MSDHARLSPSSSGRWIFCPGSARLDLPDSGSDEADEGTLAHALGEEWLRTGVRPEFPSQEMDRAVEMYVEFVQDIPGTRYLEQRLTHPSFPPDFWGTADCVIFDTKTLYIIDYKHGLYAVAPENNHQLMSYLILARAVHGRRQDYFAAIVQPRVRSPYFVSYTNDELDEFERKVIDASTSDEIIAGSHCRFCPLLPTCETAHRHGQELARQTFDDITDLDTQLRKERCLGILAYKESYLALASHAEEELKAMAMGGEKIPGMKLVTPLGNRKWNDEEDAARILRGRGLRKKDVIVEKLKSPAQLEKDFKKLKNELGELTHRPVKGVSLVDENSNHPDYDPIPFDILPT